MLVVVSDTHSREESKLQGRTAEAVREAELVVHAGDFYREPVSTRSNRPLDGSAAFTATTTTPRSGSEFRRSGPSSTRAFDSRSHTAIAAGTRGW